MYIGLGVLLLGRMKDEQTAQGRPSQQQQHEDIVKSCRQSHLSSGNFSFFRSLRRFEDREIVLLLSSYGTDEGVLPCWRGKLRVTERLLCAVTSAGGKSCTSERRQWSLVCCWLVKWVAAYSERRQWWPSSQNYRRLVVQSSTDSTGCTKPSPSRRSAADGLDRRCLAAESATPDRCYNVNVIQYFCFYVDGSSAQQHSGGLEDSTSATSDPAPPLTDSGNKLAITVWAKKLT